MKLLFIIVCILLSHVGSAQVLDFKDSLYVELGLTRDQRSKINKINNIYLADMHGIKDRADTGYNPPKHIQYQHVYTLIRRLWNIKRVVSPEQYEKIRSLRFDIYEYKDWLVNFYKKNKLPTIQEAVAKREARLSPDDIEVNYQ